ncbi:MAG: SsrA-binding protein SmpB [Fimbriimonadaceae bacterium]
MTVKKKTQTGEPRQISNRRARYDYEISDTYEAGIALIGSEVKSVFLGHAHLSDAYCRISNGELFLINMDIEPYANATVDSHERRRDRKLLLHRKELNLIDRRSLEKGLALIPLRVYFSRGKVKVEVGLGRGKSKYDKRDKIAANESRREVERARSEKF